ncbi:hypothetical protein [Legionella maioricensis]|uniref:Uncharacterized protein n=1 Tax=Legionella maioricensis TaxID=2896528 RepID=A0A9X2CXU9_9GAMM|nr:hypothetical protein [Legionella maioricensis]MCL9682726.1 hypothetical protein [Legionella maioricensis]MCL9687226.1 hypothetical protein [Legionella maioricensis]
MAFFLKNKTVHELHIHLQSLPLNELIELNKKYGPHVIEIDARMERAEAQLKLVWEKLAQQEERYQLLLATEPKVMEEEAERAKTLANLEQGGSRSEKYLLRASLNSYSPLESYKINVASRLDAIKNSKQQIIQTEKRVQAAKNDMHLTALEISILNQIIKARKEAEQAAECANSDKAVYPQPSRSH